MKKTKFICSPQELADSLLQCFLLDVRTSAEFRESHIEGSFLQPLAELNPEEVKSLIKDKSACVVICGSGKRAEKAAQELRASGMDAVVVLEGGIQAWEEAGLPLERSIKAVSLERQVRISAGILVALGTLLAWLVSPAWLILPGIVGCGLVFAGITDTCGMGLLLAKMPWNR